MQQQQLLGGAGLSLPIRQQQLGCGGQHPRRGQVGEVLQGGEGLSGPSQQGSSNNWGLGESILGVPKWGRCCKAGRGRAALPTRQQHQLGCGGQHPKRVQVVEEHQGGEGQSSPFLPGSSSN